MLDSLKLRFRLLWRSGHATGHKRRRRGSHLLLFKRVCRYVVHGFVENLNVAEQIFKVFFFLCTTDDVEHRFRAGCRGQQLGDGLQRREGRIRLL